MKCREKSQQYWATVRKNPSIVWLTLLIWVCLFGAGLAVSFVIQNSERKANELDAVGLAEETGQWFSEKLDQALLPVFSLAQFVNQISELQTLPDQLPPFDAQFSSTHRNVTGICDEPNLLARFNEIAAGIKESSRMEGILVNLQLAPQAVVCTSYPLNNTEDFEWPSFLDNTGAIGHDLLQDPARKFIAEQTVPADDLVIAGPLRLTQCPECPSIVRQALIARLPIYSNQYNMTVKGETWPRWGFAVAIIAWNKLVDESGVYHQFANRGLAFRLTRTDRMEKNGKVITRVVNLAETPDFPDLDNVLSVSTDLLTTNNEWRILVVYGKDEMSTVALVVLLTSLLLSLCIALLVHLVLLQKQIHNLTKTKQARELLDQARQATENEQNLNATICHEVRNPLAAAIAACNFVSTTVRSDSFDKKIVLEDLTIVDNSLHFVNDMLRSILDTQRVVRHQMSLTCSEAFILEDILEPVCGLLYVRDEAFNLQVRCEPLLSIQIDRLRLQQVVLNLGRNAAKFVETGYIVFRSGVNKDGHVFIAIEDSGPGIAPDKRANLFSKYQESNDNLAQGTGIGLSLCETLVELMGGEIYLDEDYKSTIEGCPGTRIVINLKQAPGIVRQGEDQNKEVKQAPWGIPENLRVLIVDDDRVLRKLGIRSLGKICSSWEFREAANGEAALQITEKEHFDLILMDQYMACTHRSLKGTETVRRMRANGVKSTIIGLSASHDSSVAFRNAGADQFWLKPIPCRDEELQRELRKLLRPRSVSDTSDASTSEHDALCRVRAPPRQDTREEDLLLQSV